jgi:hypothetical protein
MKLTWSSNLANYEDAVTLDNESKLWIEVDPLYVNLTHHLERHLFTHFFEPNVMPEVKGVISTRRYPVSISNASFDIKLPKPFDPYNCSETINLYTFIFHIE